MSVPSWCRVGAKVVCVEAEPSPFSTSGDSQEANPNFGEIYTIRAVLWSVHFQEVHILLEEVVNPPALYSDSAHVYEFGTLIRYFKPVVEIEVSNEIEARLYRQNAVKRPDRIAAKLNQPERVK